MKKLLLSLALTASTFAAPFLGTTELATAANLTTVSNALPLVNVKRLGVVGDFSTDDTTAIRNALATYTNRTLFFPRGVYKITGTLPIYQGTHILGEGAGAGFYSQSFTTVNPSQSLVELTGQSVIFLAGASNVPMFTNALTAEVFRTETSAYDGRGTISQRVYNATMRNIVLHGNARSQSQFWPMVHLTDAWDVTFESVYFYLGSGHAVHAHNCNNIQFLNNSLFGDHAKSKGYLLFDCADILMRGGRAGGMIGPALWLATPTSWLNNISGMQIGDPQNLDFGGKVLSVTTNSMTLSADPKLQTGAPFVFWTRNDVPGTYSANVTAGKTYFAIRFSSTVYGFNDSITDALAGTPDTITDAGSEMWLMSGGPSVALYLSGGAKQNTFSGMRFDNGRDGNVIFDNAAHNVLTDSLITRPGYNGGGSRLDRYGLWIRSGASNIVSNVGFAEAMTPARIDSAGNYLGLHSILSCTSNNVLTAGTLQPSLSSSP